jgi:hypothetical protein
LPLDLRHQQLVPVIGAVHVAGSQLRGQAVPVIVEQKQRVVADRLEMPVIGAAFLLSVYWTLARIHVEYNAVGTIHELGLREHVSVHGHQSHEVLLTGQQLGLEPMQRRGQRRASVPPLRRADQAKRWVGGESLRVVEVFIAGQAAVHRLPQQIHQPELGVQSLSAVAEVLRDGRLQPQSLIQLTDQNEAGVGRDSRPLEADLQEPVERELKWLVL